MSLRTTVIPVAGMGTRFLPATKSIPKEMFPLIDRPLIQYSVQEATAAGCEQVVLVSAPGKESILTHFQPDPALEDKLRARGRDDLLRAVRAVSDLALVRSVIQPEALGVGHAILQARSLVGDEDFAVMFPDDFVVAEVAALEQLRRVHQQRGGLVFAVEPVPRQHVGRYGVIAGDPVGDGVYRVRDMVEKPSPQQAPSELAIIGRYVLPGEIFRELERTPPGAGGEIQLTDAMRALIQRLPCHAVRLRGRRFDCGNRIGFLQATVHLAAQDPELAGALREAARDALDREA